MAITTTGGTIYDPEEILQWLNDIGDGDDTYLCPYWNGYEYPCSDLYQVGQVSRTADPRGPDDGGDTDIIEWNEVWCNDHETECIYIWDNERVIERIKELQHEARGRIPVRTVRTTDALWR